MKMNSGKVKKLYIEHIERSTPDMDALWEKIESGLEPKRSDGVTSKPVRKRLSFGSAPLKWAVCVAALLIIPISVRIINNSSVSKNLDAGTSGGQQMALNGGSDMKDGGAAEDAAGVYEPSYDAADQEEIPADESYVYDNETSESTEANRKVIFYEELFSDQAVAIAATKGETSGDDFFVEENVLTQTDVIVTAYINNVYSKGDSVCYEITAENAETFETENLVIESATPYVMKQDRTYLLPLKAENGDYRLVFENAPQIEFAENGGIIFHNGWRTLDAFEDDPVTVIYPQNGIDDFFYDRMMFSYRSDIKPLMDEWFRLRQTK